MSTLQRRKPRHEVMCSRSLPPVAGPPLPGHWWLLTAGLLAAPSPELAAREVRPPPQRPGAGRGPGGPELAGTSGPEVRIRW